MRAYHGRLPQTPSRGRFTYRYPASASVGALAKAFPLGVSAELTPHPDMILTPLLLIYPDRPIKIHKKRLVLTHRRSGSRIAGPAPRYCLLRIAAAMMGTGLDWKHSKRLVESQARLLPIELRKWFLELYLLGLKEFKNYGKSVLHTSKADTGTNGNPARDGSHLPAMPQ